MSNNYTHIKKYKDQSNTPINLINKTYNTKTFIRVEGLIGFEGDEDYVKYVTKDVLKKWGS